MSATNTIGAKKKVTPGLKAKRTIWEIIIHLLLIIGGIIMLIPFIWMISTSFKLEGKVFIYPPQWIPNPVSWQGYKDAWTLIPFGLGYLNSLKITSLVVIGTIFTSSLAAYAFAKMHFFGRDKIFIGLLATMMIPGQITLIPMFIFFKRIGWIDTHWPLIVPWVLRNPFGVFLLRQFFLAIPDDLLDAARIDGCSSFRIYWNIMLPLSIPALATLGIFTFMGSWNDFLTPLIYLDTLEKFTVPLLVSAARGLYYNKWTLMMASSAIAIIPVMIAYFFGQRYFIQGITLTGLKE